MALQLASTTDTPEQIAQTMKDAGLEPEAPETPETPATEPEPAAAAAQPGEGETAAAPEAAIEPKEPTGEPEEHEDDEVPVIEPEPGTQIPKGIRKEMNRLARRRAEERDKRIAAETRLTELERQIAELKAGTAKPSTEPEPAQPAKPAEPEPKTPPKLKDYTQAGGAKYVEGEDYDDAMQRYIDDRDEMARAAHTPEKTRAEVQAELDRQARVEEANAHVDAARERHPDFDEKVTDQVQISPAMIDAAWEDPETAPEIFYHLATHPDDLKRVMDLTLYPANSDPNTILRANRAAARECLRIQNLVKQQAPTPAAPPAAPPAPKKPAAPPAKRVSNAPAPIEPVGSGAAPAPRKSPDSMSPSEYNRWLATPEGQEWYHSQRR